MAPPRTVRPRLLELHAELRPGAVILARDIKKTLADRWGVKKYAARWWLEEGAIIGLWEPVHRGRRSTLWLIKPRPKITEKSPAASSGDTGGVNVEEAVAWFKDQKAAWEMEKAAAAGWKAMWTGETKDS